MPKQIKYGKFYFSYLSRINSDYKNFNDLLRKQLELAEKKIPYYKNIKYKSIRDFPIITKETIRNDFNAFVNSDSSNFIKANTGGTSGTPFEFYLEKGVSRPKEKAHFDWYWNQFGFNEGNKILMIRGESLAGNKLYEFQAIENRLAISCYLINSSNIHEVIKVINKFEPHFIHAYPSALISFMDYVNDCSMNLKLNIKCVFLGSESLILQDKKRIETYFNSKISHWYGHSERLVHAGNCPFSDEFHIYPFYGYLELVDALNNVIDEPEKKGRIIATGFDNSIMPLIRYDTGDEAEYSTTSECQCGFKGKSLTKIYGRVQDYIFLNDNTKVSLTAFIFGQHFDEFALIEEIQLEQVQLGKLLIRIVSKSPMDFDRNKFIGKLKDSVKDKIEIELQFVKEIPKTKRGKHIFLIQKTKI
ncbi:phenylacetate--CoA ligase family protein [Pontimicrobium aquaticum]|uniref:Phenylacetate--CoA ligase family protein n=1 Tax=Pontimicrobium aquaticum TaxID=2565367 RepID=A0A4U0ESK6_9FLAO|nr:phenylacetate--CoA ligase family protein [Pontimicrobium aquaticum]TJY34765.1 phenylacetate--CoA ligase family protein [Pontimicrobium aquaticum]